MNDFSLQATSPENDLIEELAFSFFDRFHALEAALVRAGFTRVDCIPAYTRPDWGRFIRQIEAQFDPACSPDLARAVRSLLDQPGKHELRQEQSSPVNDLLWLSVLVQEIRFKLLHQINSAETDLVDDGNIKAAILVVQAWSHLDPRVESRLGQG